MVYRDTEGEYIRKRIENFILSRKYLDKVFLDLNKYLRLYFDPAAENIEDATASVLFEKLVRKILWSSSREIEYGLIYQALFNWLKKLGSVVKFWLLKINMER